MSAVEGIRSLLPIKPIGTIRTCATKVCDSFHQWTHATHITALGNNTEEVRDSQRFASGESSPPRRALQPFIVHLRVADPAYTGVNC